MPDLLDDLLLVIGLSLLPATGNLIGNMIAEMVRPPRWVTGVALHGAAGIAIALISFDLLPRIVDAVPLLLVIAAFLVGAALSLLVATGIHLLQREATTGDPRRLGAWMVYAAICADLFSDGMMTGTGTAVSASLGMLIAAAQLIANIPGGFAVAANLRTRQISKRTRILSALAMFSGVVISAMLGFLALRDSSPLIQNAILAIFAGLLLLATIEDMIPEADAPRPSRWISTLAFSLGFAGLALASHYLLSG